MAAHNYQSFLGVASISTYLGNIRTVAAANGWTVDKDSISSDGELYIHSTGIDGNQLLYFSFKIRAARDDSSKKYLVWHCNTGFDGGSSWDAQPGRFSVLPKTGWLADEATWFYDFNTDIYNQNYDGGDFAHWVIDPCPEQFVFVNAQTIFCIQRVVHTCNNGHVFAGYSSFVIGAMDSVSGSGEGELNFTLASPWGHCGAFGTMFQPWMAIPTRDLYRHEHRCTIQPFGMLYGGSNAIDLPGEDYEGYSGSCLKCFYSSVGLVKSYSAARASSGWNTSETDHWNTDGLGNGHCTYMPHPPQRGVDYSAILISNPGMAKTVFHKPLITIEDQTGDTHYCYPTRASLPYYACALNPYLKAEQIVSVGSRSFMVFPLLDDTDTIGFAIEVSA